MFYHFEELKVTLTVPKGPFINNAAREGWGGGGGVEKFGEKWLRLVTVRGGDRIKYMSSILDSGQI